MAAYTRYSYRNDPDIPTFDDRHPLLIYDGVCVLCSGFVKFIVRHDKAGRFRFVAAQSALGEALFRHYGFDTHTYETNLVLADGKAHAKMRSFSAVMARLPWPWRILAIAALLPGPIGNPIYAWIARNRYRWFGRTDNCMVPDATVRSRFLG